MKFARALLIGHLAALLFGLAGLLIALPNPQWWAGDPRALQVFDFGMSYGGATHILFGAAAMFAYAWVVIGKRRTLVFFAASCLLSLASELIGTGTGWPFGNYAYTEFLGYKVLGRVPFTIPLSWFYLGLAAYMLGSLLASRLRSHLTFWALFFGVWLLTAWDLVLDPAMADPSLRVQFWTWHESGPYFGMPIQNLVGWSVTGLLYMGLSRLLWRRNMTPLELAPTSWFPFAVYAANLIFAMVLSLGAGLWPPVVLALIAGMAPAWLATRAPGPGTEGVPSPVAWRSRTPEAPRQSA
ncbi:MAG: carotenoid biosynthesis protein [Thermomicrobiales bacterium]